MRGNYRKAAYLCAALCYGGLAIFFTKNYLGLLIKGMPSWVGVLVYIITMLPFLWLLHRGEGKNAK